MSQRLSDTPPPHARRSPHPYHPLTGMTIGEVVRVLYVTALRCSVTRILCAPLFNNWETDHDTCNAYRVFCFLFLIYLPSEEIMMKTSETKIEVAKTAAIAVTAEGENKRAVKKTPSGFKAVTDADKAKARKEAKPKTSDKALPVKTQIIDDVPTEVGYDASLKTAAFQAVYGEYKDVLDAAEELLNSIGNAETKQAKFVTAVLKNAAKLQRVKPNSAAPLLRAAYRTIKSQLFRGYARKTFAVLNERCGISFDGEGTPSQLFDPDKADKLAEWLSVGGRKIGMIKTESDKPKQSEFDPWRSANKFLNNLKDYASKTENVTERANRMALFETMAGSIDRACRKYEGKSLKAFLSE